MHCEELQRNKNNIKMFIFLLPSLVLPEMTSSRWIQWNWMSDCCCISVWGVDSVCHKKKNLRVESHFMVIVERNEHPALTQITFKTKQTKLDAFTFCTKWNNTRHIQDKLGALSIAYMLTEPQTFFPYCRQWAERENPHSNLLSCVLKFMPRSAGQYTWKPNAVERYPWNYFMINGTVETKVPQKCVLHVSDCSCQSPDVKHNFYPS